MKKYPLIDILKYAFAFLVIAIHTFPFSDISPAFNLIFIASLCRIAVPFFFIASAFFFFKGKRDLKHYLKRVLWLYLVWTLIYSPFILRSLMQSTNIALSLLRLLIDLFVNGSYYHLWFLPALMLGMYLTDKIERKWGLKTLVMISLVLYFIGYLINIYGYHLNIGLINNYLDVFETSRNGIFFGLPYLTIGALLAKKKEDLRFDLLGFALSIIVFILEVATYFYLGYLNSLSSMYLSLWPLSYFFFALVLDISQKYTFKDHLMLRKASTFIYTSHIIFAIILAPFIDNHLIYYLLVALCSAASAFTLLKLNKLPLIKYLF